MSIRFKTILVIALIELVFLALLLRQSLHYLGSTNVEQLRERAHTEAHLIAVAIKNAVIAQDFATLEALAPEAIREAHDRKNAFTSTSPYEGYPLAYPDRRQNPWLQAVFSPH